LRQEGIAREFINRIQNLRKDSDFDVTDKISILVEKKQEINDAIINFKDYIASQTLAKSIDLTDKIEQNDAKDVEIDNNIKTKIYISRN
jgi:isoleucyl-tRNA synthetase